jgi:hypothetical protein
MEFNFTTKQLLNGEAEYSIKQFRADLLAEINKTSDVPVEQHEQYRDWLYSFYYSFATGKQPLEIVALANKQPIPEAIAIVEDIQKDEKHKKNYDILEAVLQKRYLEVLRDNPDLTETEVLILYNAEMEEENKEHLDYAWKQFKGEID